jgi:7-cyano-7-deazaguanine synthase
MTKSALVIFSGGQDSTTSLYWAKSMFEEVHAISFYYGQHHSIELDAAKAIAKMAGVKSWQQGPLFDVLQSVSPLLKDGEGLERYASHAEMETIIGSRVEKTFVPMRNALFLVVAANRAVALGIEDLVIGVCEADNANYPDCRAGFVNAAAQMINFALGSSSFKVWAPLIRLTKAQSIALAKTLPGCMEALAFSHTSYAGDYPPLDQNHATVLRAQGFLEANEPDPLIVRAWREGLMPLPESSNYDEVRKGLP